MYQLISRPATPSVRPGFRPFRPWICPSQGMGDRPLPPPSPTPAGTPTPDRRAPARPAFVFVARIYPVSHDRPFRSPAACGSGRGRGGNGSRSRHVCPRKGGGRYGSNHHRDPRTAPRWRNTWPSASRFCSSAPAPASAAVPSARPGRSDRCPLARDWRCQGSIPHNGANDQECMRRRAFVPRCFTRARMCGQWRPSGDNATLLFVRVH